MCLLFMSFISYLWNLKYDDVSLTCYGCGLKQHKQQAHVYLYVYDTYRYTCACNL